MQRVWIPVMLSAFAVLAWSVASGLEPGREGWQTWRVEALGGGFAGCCFSAGHAGCSLDRGNLMFASGLDCGDALLALLQLPGDAGVGTLRAVFESGGLERDVREQALFWLVSSGSDEAFSYLDALLSDD